MSIRASRFCGRRCNLDNVDRRRNCKQSSATAAVSADSLLRLAVTELQAEVPVRADVGVVLSGLVLANEASRSHRPHPATEAMSQVQDRHDAFGDDH